MGEGNDVSEFTLLVIRYHQAVALEVRCCELEIRALDSEMSFIATPAPADRQAMMHI